MTDLVTTATGWLEQAERVALGWLLSPAAWSQFALLILTYLAARLTVARAEPVLKRFLPTQAVGLIAKARRFALRFLPLMLPLVAYALTAGGEGVKRSLFGSGAVIAFGKRVFLLLAARALAQKVLTDGFLRLLGRFVLMPAALLYALGVLVPALERLDLTQVALGKIRFSVLSLLRGGIAGALLSWFGKWSNFHSADYIKRQDELQPATRELALKAAELAIFGAAFLLLMQITGIDLTAVAFLGGALGVGIGLGLQQIAANFVPGLILLLEGQTTIGDYVELDGGQAGTIIKMTAHACVLEEFNGRWIVVPNDHFIISRVINYSSEASPNRYETLFSVSYDTEMNRVPGMVAKAGAALPFVLSGPEAPQCDLKSFGDSAVNFGVSGVDGGANKYMSPVLFAIWNARKNKAIRMPYRQRVIEIKGGFHG